MEKISKEDFYTLAAVRPHTLIGKEIILKDGKFAKIIDISLGGNYIFIEDKSTSSTTWIKIDNILGEDVTLDSPISTEGTKIISINTLNQLIAQQSEKIVDSLVENDKLKEKIIKKPDKIIDFSREKRQKKR